MFMGRRKKSSEWDEEEEELGNQEAYDAGWKAMQIYAERYIAGSKNYRCNTAL